MNHIPSSVSPEESRKFPVSTLLGAIVILAAAVAILVFDVPIGTVLTYGLLGLMLFGHFFMHGSHGGHDHGASPTQQSDERSHSNTGTSQISAHNHADGPDRQDDPETDSAKDKDSHQGHSGC